MPWLLASPQPFMKKTDYDNDFVEPFVEVDQCEIIPNDLIEVVYLEITKGELKESPFVSSAYVYQAKSTFFALHRILQSGHLTLHKSELKTTAKRLCSI